MGYLEEFKKHIDRRDFNKFYLIWEEYCTNDTVDVAEFIKLLKLIQASEIASSFGKIVESALTLWQQIEDKQSAFNVLKLLIDLQTSNSPMLGQTAYKALESVYGNDPEFKERIRLVGLRNYDSFQGAISNYELLAHCKKGKFVFHNAGWGTSEIVDISPLREQVTLECEDVVGLKHLTFQKAFRTLTPVADDSFLALRFGKPDALEEEARRSPVKVVKLLLEQLGPKTAAEIKDELLDLVIPDKDWNRFWQTARPKLKKDPHIQSPTSIKDPFTLRDTAVSHKQELLEKVEEAQTPAETLQYIYAFVRDLPKDSKEENTRKSLYEKIGHLLEEPSLTYAQELQVLIFFEEVFEKPHPTKKVEDWLKSHDDLDKIVDAFDVVPFKKEALKRIRNIRPDWADIFQKLLLVVHPLTLRDYLLKELQENEKSQLALNEYLTDITTHPTKEPEGFFWYFQKVLKKDGSKVPHKSSEQICRLFDSFLVLIQQLENDPQYRDLVKKMINFTTAGRYALVRQIFEDATLEETAEFLLLASKIQEFSKQDKTIFQSLASVVHPSLDVGKKEHFHENILWTTEDSFQRIKSRIEEIATKEMRENTKEIEIAREHGDLRENAEYKFAKERRAQLQRELKTLSEQMNHARIITLEDISPAYVGVGAVIELKSDKGKEITFTILGPWDADAEKNILSFQSKLAQAMMGKERGETFQFREEAYTILDLKNYLETTK